MECMGWDGYRGGNVGTKKDVAIRLARECESRSCPLYNFRTGVETTPGREKKIPTAQQKTVQDALKSRQKLKKVAIQAQS